MRVGILDHLPGIWVEASQLIHVLRCVPNPAVPVDAKSVWARSRAGQLEFLKRFGLGVEVGDLA